MPGPDLGDVDGVRQPVEAGRVVVDVPDQDVHRVFDHLWRRARVERVSIKFNSIVFAQPLITGTVSKSSIGRIFQPSVTPYRAHAHRRY